MSAKQAVKEEVDIFEEEEQIKEPEDIEAGIMAERDPASRAKDLREYEQATAVDVVKKSLDGQVTALGRRTAELLKDRKKHKVLIPKNELNPNDTFVVASINGWTLQIKRNEPVYLPNEVIDLLISGGYNPTLVR